MTANPLPGSLPSLRAKFEVLTSGSSHFVGFHDITPWNRTTDELVCLATLVGEDRAPGTQDIAHVVVIDPRNRLTEIIGETAAWNWQKAARQQFLPPLGRRVVAFNVTTPTGFACKLVDLDATSIAARTLIDLPRAIYDFAPNGAFGLALDMRRLARCQPGYGYAHPTIEIEDPRCDGIWRVDTQSGRSVLLLSIAEFLTRAQIHPDLGEHYFTHIQVSPDSQRYAFMHRCFLESGGLMNNLVVGNSETAEFEIIHDDKMSHFDWSGPDSIIVWCRQNTALKALKESHWKILARPLYQLSKRIRSNAIRQNVYKESFRKIDLSTGKKEIVGRGVLTEDGHPQVNPVHPHIWVNDTYPNSRGLQTLMLFDAKSNLRRDLLTLPTQPQIQETIWRCDFHPRWNPSGSVICFDSAHAGRRQVCILDVSAYLTGIGIK